MTTSSVGHSVLVADDDVVAFVFGFVSVPAVVSSSSSLAMPGRRNRRQSRRNRHRHRPS